MAMVYWHKTTFWSSYLSLTRRPSIWLIAALSLSVHSATTLARISFMYNMKAFSGFLMCGFFLSEKKRHTQNCWAAVWIRSLTQIQGFDHYDWLTDRQKFKHMANSWLQHPGQLADHLLFHLPILVFLFLILGIGLLPKVTNVCVNR